MFGICASSPSPQPSPREEREEGEVIARRCCLNLNSSRSGRGVLAHDADRVRFDPPLVTGLDDNAAGLIER